MQNIRGMKKIVVLAALLFMVSIGYAQKKTKDEKNVPAENEISVQKPNDFRKSEIYTMLIPRIAFLKFKDQLESAEKLVAMSVGENVLRISVTNPSPTLIRDLRIALESMELDEKGFFTDVLPWIMMTGDDGKDIPNYLNSLIEFYKMNPEVIYFAPKSYKEFPSESNIGKFYNYQRELGHITKF